MFRRDAGEAPWIYAHRGAPRVRPENTLESFAAGLDAGADGVELDVRFAGSGEVIVLHDPDTARVAGRRLIAARTSLVDLRALDLGGGARVPLLDDAIDLVAARAALLNVEIKTDGDDARMRSRLARAVIDTLHRHTRRAEERTVISSFDPVVLAAVRALAPHVATAYLFETSTAAARLRSALVVRALRPAGVHPGGRDLDPAALAAWRRGATFVNVWTVDDPARARALDAAGADGIITNDVPAVRAALALRGGAGFS